jgi:probable HAF family extracellular repeat protein
MNKFAPGGSLRSRRRREDGVARCWALARKFALGLSLTLACQCALAQAVYRIEPLGWLDGCTTYAAVAAGLNEADQVTGSACTPTSSSHAFLWKSGGTPMVDLGPPEAGSFSHAQALNASGLVIGDAQQSSTGDFAFLASHGPPMTTIPDGLGGNSILAWAINDHGQVTGQAETAVGSGDAFVWKNDGSSMVDLGNLGGVGNSFGTAINASGQVAGNAAAGNGTDHAFVWKNNGAPMLDLGTLGGGFSEALFINRSGQVAGNSDAMVGKRLQTHAFLWKNNGTPMQDLGTLGGAASYVTAFNDSGQVAGNSYTYRLRNKRAFVWLNDATPMQDLGSLGGTYSQASDMNSSGQVTGQATLAGNAVHHAFLWRNDGSKIQDLNTLIDPTDPLKPHVTLFNGDFINDRGDIVADGTDNRTGLQGLYLLHGTALVLAPRSLAFGNHPIHTISAAKSVTVTNTSVKAVAITSVALAGSAPGQFSITDNCGASLTGHASCAVQVIFRPTTKGSKSALLNVNGGRGGLLSVHLTGTGT